MNSHVSLVVRILSSFTAYLSGLLWQLKEKASGT